MPTYTYQALDQAGKKRKGSLESESQAKAFRSLQDRGLTPVQLTKVQEEMSRTSQSSSLSWIKWIYGTAGIKVEEAFYSLGLMLQGGSSLAQSLELLGQMGQGRTSRIWQNVRDSVESGVSFSQALQEHPRIFFPVYIGMIQVAEKTGHLGHILERIAAYEERRREMQSKLLTALAYPLIVLLIGIGAIYFLLANILPKIAGIFQASGQDLPAYTRFLLALSQWLGEWGAVVLILVPVFGFCTGWAYRNVSRFRYRVDTYLWKIPVLRDSILCKFSGLLAFQLGTGISLVQAMQGALQGIPSSFFRERMQAAAEEVATGQSLDQVLDRLDFLPQMYLTALGAGQKAGQLPAFLERLSRILEHRVDTTLRRIIGLLEPLLILVLGLVIGFFVLAVMEPIFDLTSQIS
jgi:type II secretory pathway component PulF